MFGGSAAAVILQTPRLAAKYGMLNGGQVNVGGWPGGCGNCCGGNAMAGGGPTGGQLHMDVGQMDATIGEVIYQAVGFM